MKEFEMIEKYLEMLKKQIKALEDELAESDKSRNYWRNKYKELLKEVEG